ncbi:hypothetical protein BBO99_00002307 [Phytophthora kernoviae]|uniref:RRM domain-containing protein n=2 Tax=Phytophthora kernoviae TaxID=325452 RepID=A0A3R7K232_9STRA|nr:hypothetical protein G195_002764 [Phytophthora kernoviae 00238/432]KAG2529767.1 hypothetical protein JM16_001939 [Phytophthora kernoviae]KAG2530992.1 hypothetical protein JM18_001928 [Phytophthora kernoviae]RLN06788.1 hypothetical protein BBI17_002159 [Phytophthora kernoviae]RLN83223.1 hypothetical protein BBO99_00002307 [Phytophthora kernoviae]
MRPGVISETELNRQRLAPGDLRMEQLMTSYERGLPSPVVMVQNIAETVDEKDLRSIFGYVLPLDVTLE